MQSIISGHATFFTGEFEDKQTKKKVPYHQLAVVEKSETCLNLIKASVPADKVEEAIKFDNQQIEMLCDLKETNYNGKAGMKMVFIKAKVKS